MFKKNLLIVGLISALVIGFLALNYFHNTGSTKVIKSNIEKPIYRVAALIPISHPALEKIISGFSDKLKNDQFDFEIKIYNANGNKVLMRSQVEDILSRNFDLIAPIATTPTQMVIELARKKDIKTPIVFAAASTDPNAGVVDVNNNAPENVAGVSDDLDLNKQVDMLKFLKPHVKSVLIVYDSSSAGLERFRKEIEPIFEKHQIKCKSAAVANAMDISQKVPALLNGVDTVFVFKDNLVVSSIDVLVKLCSQNNITLMVSDLESVEKGAALGFGVSEYAIGAKAADLAKSILIDKVQPNSLPITKIVDAKIKINLNYLEKQDLHLDENLIFLIGSGEVFKQK